MSGFPVHHQLLELAQTHVHIVGDAIQSSHPLSSPSPPAFNLSQHQGLFQWVSSSYCFPNLEPVSCSMSSSNCCFLTCIQVSQEAGKVVWYSLLLKNYLQFVVIHTIKGFSVVNEAEVAVFVEFSCFFDDTAEILVFSMIQRMLAIWSLVPLPFLKPAWTSGTSWLKPGLENFEHYFNSVWDECNCV